MKLTKATLPLIKVLVGRTEILVFDEAMPGFGLRMRIGGKRTWIAQYRIGLKQRRLTLGSTDKLDADEARKRARAALAKAQLGVDPQLEKHEVRTQASITFASVREGYLLQAPKRLSERTLEETKRHLNRHWAPLSQMPLAHIRRATIALRLGEIAAENGPHAANRARASLSAFFSWAIGEGLADVNPVVGTNKLIDEEPRDRVLADEELAAVWLYAGDGEYGRIVRLLILTGQRRDEVGGLPWPEIDVSRAVWTIAASRTKNGLAHDVPLSKLAIEILMSQPRHDGRDLVFGLRSGPFQGWSSAKKQLDLRIAEASRGKSLKPWRLHDLRRTMATRLGDLGTMPHVVEATLNHVSGFRAGVAGTYNRAAYAAEKREALDRWSERLGALLAKAR